MSNVGYNHNKVSQRKFINIVLATYHDYEAVSEILWHMNKSHDLKVLTIVGR